jgi:hypothetical protein
MPLHDYIKQIYEDTVDSAYIIRFLDYLIQKRYRRTTFVVNDVIAIPLITGILENVKTKERYYSLAEFYLNVTGQKINETDISLLTKINITMEYSVMRIICNNTEDDILGFFDQKYRTFLMYRDVKKRIMQYTSINIHGHIDLFWNDNEYNLNHIVLISKNNFNTYKCYELLETYEDGPIQGLYYCGKEGRHLISAN